ncbi:hypothetical protein BpHYR1_003140 [Brachionus plicatilis]|uniref:Uncharacterized protein n=1 Tax=Brachionus plicatilis TaxID=10195 RepID=A0A3M7QA44_BRAPC|nr:hypothetical protein BpHYR1_003140 [Brachionus plicatilis]
MESMENYYVMLMGGPLAVWNVKQPPFQFRANPAFDVKFYFFHSKLDSLLMKKSLSDGGLSFQIIEKYNWLSIFYNLDE